jgi:hypothetical protein
MSSDELNEVSAKIYVDPLEIGFRNIVSFTTLLKGFWESYSKVN